MNRIRAMAAIVGTGVGVVALVRRIHRPLGREVPGGTLIRDAGGYDRNARWLLGGFFNGIAKDVAATAASGDRVLEIGCGPGHLAIRLAVDHGLDVTAIDLDPEMIERAVANASLHPSPTRRLEFVSADVAALPFTDAVFDLIVSTMSMHHWASPAAGLSEIERVLKPGGRAVIWDFRPGRLPLHRDMPDPLAELGQAPLRVADVRPWSWPGPLALTRRIELVREEGHEARREPDVPAAGLTTPSRRVGAASGGVAR